jgi:hypothetical protein
MFTRRIHLVVAAAALAAVMAVQADALAGGVTVIATDGTSSPNGGALSFSPGHPPVINDSGYLAFDASLQNSNSGRRNNQVIIRAQGSALVELARAGQSIPGSTHRIDTFGHAVVMNAAGIAVKHGTTFVTPGGEFEGYGIWSMDDGTISQLARDGQSIGEADLRFSDFGYQPTLNDAGQFAFQSGIDTSTQDGFAVGVFVADGTTIKQVAGSRQPAPDGNGQLRDLYNVSLNNLGHVAFAGTFSNANGDFIGSGVFRSDGSTLTQVARSGQSTPNGVFASFGSGIALNDAGQMALLVGVLSSGNSAVLPAIYRGNGATLSPVISSGESVVGKPGQLTRLSNPSQNAAGTLAVLTEVVEGGSSGVKEALLHIGQSGVLQVARAGDEVPGNNGRYSKFSEGDFFSPPISLNDSGQIAFYADLTATPGGSTDNAAIFIFDPSSGVSEIVRKGAPLLGSTIADLELSSDTGAMDRVGSAINSIGQIAFAFALTDGRRGVAVWSVPEPSTMVLSVVFPLFLRRVRRSALTAPRR